MSKKYKNIDDLFKKEFSNFQPEPPDHVWESIYNEIEDSKNQRNFPYWMKIAASIAAIIIPTFFLLWLAPFSKTEISDANIATDTESIMSSAESIEQAIITAEIQPKTDFLEEVPKIIEVSELSEGELTLTTGEKTEKPAQHEIMPFKSIERIAYEQNLNSVFAFNEQILTKTTINVPEISLFAQYSEPIKSTNKHTFSAYASPHYSSNFLLGNPMMSTGISFETLEDNIKTYSYGFKYTYKTASRLSVESGINYFTIGQVVKEILSFGVEERHIEQASSVGETVTQSALTSMGEVSFTNNSFYFADITSYRIAMEKESPFGEPVLLEQCDNNISQYLSFIDVPLILKYRLVDYFDIDFSLRLGASGSYLVSNQVYLGEGNTGQLIGVTKNVNSFNYAAIGGLSIELPVTNNIKLLIEPTTRVSFMPISDNSYGVITYPISLFINTGISYRL